MDSYILKKKKKKKFLQKIRTLTLYIIAKSIYWYSANSYAIHLHTSITLQWSENHLYFPRLL